MNYNPPRRKCAAVNNTKQIQRSEERFDIRHGTGEFGVCPASFWFCFGPVFSHYATFPVFLNGNVYLVTLYVGSM